ncbi:MAG: hypothetical protein WBF58_20510 [Xanthobacteraceae bacterium]
MSVTAVRTLCVMLTIPALTCGLLSCSDGGDPNAWYNKTVVENFGGHTAPATDAPDQAVAPGGVVVAAPPGTPMAAPGTVVAAAGGPVVVPPTGPVPIGELYWSDSSCGVLPPPATAVGGVAAAAIAPAPTDVTLQMTECEVARRAGRPDKVELTPVANGLRMLTLSYLRGPQPRVYHFVAGRLVSVEYLPPPPPPPPPKRRAGHPRAM